MMKTGLVIEGGALRSAFSCGVLKVWAEAGVGVDYCVGVSLGAVAGAYFHAGQSEALENIYGDYFAATGEIGRLAALKGERVVDGPSFLETALAAHPLDMAAFAAGRGALACATTRSDNGDAVYWRLEGVGEGKQLRRFLQAAVTFPGAGEPVDLIERSYYDGALAAPLPVEEAMAQGCDRLVVIQTHPVSYTMPRPHLTPGMALALANVPMTRNAYLLSHLYYNRALKRLHALERDGRALVVAPLVESTHYRRYGVSRSAASEFYAEGQRLGAEALPRLARFLGEARP